MHPAATGTGTAPCGSTQDPPPASPVPRLARLVSSRYSEGADQEAGPAARTKKMINARRTVATCMHAPKTEAESSRRLFGRTYSTLPRSGYSQT
ncbi:uncharacterized protein PSFLO_05746 [Pseudozyma flocculosa]|uniref:Uncharacterized protein n=1 Tax=Pseudozyma flocculosa TaxID=84751 RepID=A0A5C3F723_9BASI|nr:uncharacterized protein PSFLO_05746 [Pseudozyma flocculosa]